LSLSDSVWISAGRNPAYIGGPTQTGGSTDGRLELKVSNPSSHGQPTLKPYPPPLLWSCSSPPPPWLPWRILKRSITGEFRLSYPVTPLLYSRRVLAVLYFLKFIPLLFVRFAMRPLQLNSHLICNFPIRSKSVFCLGG
jgi:hypothetical protein